MSIAIWEAPTQPFKSSLDGRLASGSSVVSLISATGLVAPGIVCIERQDGNGNDTFNKMEYCSYTSINGNVLTGVSRGLGGTVDIDHNSGSIVECFLTTTHWGDLIDFVSADHETTTGKVKAFSHVKTFSITGVSGASGIKGDVVFVPGSGITIYPISGPSLYSHLKIDYIQRTPLPQFSVKTLAIGKNSTEPIIVEKDVKIKSISFTLASVNSGASVVINVNRNYSTIFTDQNTRPGIPGSGTYVSTASIGVTSLLAGDILTLDIDNY